MVIKKIKEALRKILAEFGSISTDKGVLVWDGDDDLKEGDAVHSVDEEGNDIPVEDGEYSTEDMKVITVAEGKVVSITDIEAEVAPEEEEAPAEEPQENAEEEEAPAEDEAPAADDRDQRIADLEAEVARLEEENGALRERIAELEGEPAAEPAAEEFKKDEVAPKVNSKMQRMIEKGFKFFD